MGNTSSGGETAIHCGILWFGAAVSIAEIEAGMQIAPLLAGGSRAAIAAAVVAGHLLGGTLLFAAGWLGAAMRRNSMECARFSFGRAGAGFFAVANLLQLLGWTAVMVAQGTDAAAALLPGVPAFGLAAGIGSLVAVWIFIGRGAGRINGVAMGLLFLLTLVLSVSVLRHAPPATGNSPVDAGPRGFWTALELSVAMPVSWLPLVADYTRNVRRKIAAPAVSAAVYTLVSTWMYGIGMVAAARFGSGTLAEVLRISGLGMAGLFVVVFSTVTTTFLDANSAGESALSISRRVSAKGVGVAVAVAGTALAMAGTMDRYADFLYLIASVFAPMAAVLLADAWLRRKDIGTRTPTSWKQTLVNFIAWTAGFTVYQMLIRTGCPLGATVPSIAVAMLVRWTIGTRNGTEPRQLP